MARESLSGGLNVTEVYYIIEADAGAKVSHE